MERKVRFICEAGIIAAIYAVLTIVLAPISYGPLQVRVSEAMCVLPYFTFAAVPGLFIGCIIANAFGMVLGTSLGIMDIVVGSLATLAAALVASKIKVRWLVPLPSILFNAFLVPWTLAAMLGVPYWFSVGWVGLGQAIACYGLGMPLLLLLQKKQKAIFGT